LVEGWDDHEEETGMLLLVVVVVVVTVVVVATSTVHRPSIGGCDRELAKQGKPREELEEEVKMAWGGALIYSCIALHGVLTILILILPPLIPSSSALNCKHGS
jgi:NhaP-type Na+/H+ or K+/H+ antiporter